MKTFCKSVKRFDRIMTMSVRPHFSGPPCANNNKYVGPPYSRAKIYGARMSHGRGRPKVHLISTRSHLDAWTLVHDGLVSAASHSESGSMNAERRSSCSFL